ncbi:septation ring formation regulator EzrA [Paenibacillus elgii]
MKKLLLGVLLTLGLLIHQNALADPAPAGGVPSESAPVDPAQAVQPPAEKPQEPPSSVPAPADAPQSGKITISAGTFFLVLGTVPVLLVVLGCGIVYKLRVSWLRRRAQRLLVNVMSAAEELRPYEGNAEGSTESIVKQADERLANLTVAVSRRLTVVTETKIFFLRFVKLSRFIRDSKGELKRLRTSFKEVHAEVRRVLEAAQALSPRLQRLVDQRAAVEAEAKSRTAELAFPLNQTYEELERLRQELQQATDTARPDPVGAQRSASQAEARLQSISRDVKDIGVYLSEYRAFPGRLDQAEAKVKKLVEEHRLNLLHIDPYGSLAEARRLSEDMLEELKAGNLEQVRTTAAQVSGLLKAAVEMTQRHATFRRQNPKDIQQVQKKLWDYRTTDAALAPALARTRQCYAQEHWQDMWSRYGTIDRHVKQMEQQLPEVKRQSDDDHQDYDTARSSLDDMLARFREAEEMQRNCRSAVEQLDRGYGSLKSKQGQAWSALEAAVKQVKQNNLRFLVADQVDMVLARAESLNNELNQRLFVQPYRLGAIEQHVVRLTDLANEFAGTVKQRLEQKRQAERALGQAQSSYRSTRAKVRSRIEVRRFDAPHTSVIQRVEGLIAGGRYIEAVHECHDMDKIINEMKRLYRREIEEEQRAAAARRASASSSSSGFFGSSGSSGSFRSSGASDDDDGGGDSGEGNEDE